LKLSGTLAEPDSVWLEEVEVPILQAIRTLGYFQGSLATTAYLVVAKSHERSYVMNFNNESGPQYRLGELQVSGATLFSAELLRGQFLLRPGELFDVAKIRQSR
jgi:outer membrane protein assembly factor BamA